MTTMIADELGRIPMSPFLTATLTRAADYATAQSHREVTLEHLLLALAEDPEASVVLKSSNVDIPRLTSEVSAILGRSEDRPPGESTQSVVISQGLKRILEAAAAAAQQGRRREINGAIVLAAIVGDGRSAAAHLLRNQGLTFEEAIRALQRSATSPGLADASSAKAATPAAAPPAAAAEEARPARDRVVPTSPAPPATDTAPPVPERAIESSPAAVTTVEARPRVPDVGTPPEKPARPPRPQPFELRKTSGDPPLPRQWTPPLQRPMAEPPPPAPMPRGVGSSGQKETPPAPPPIPPTPYSGPQGAPTPRSHVPPAPGAYGAPSAGTELRRPGTAYPDRRQAGSGPFMSSWPLIEAGQLVENIPRRMRVGIPVMVEARIAKADVRALAEGLQGGGAAFRHEVMVTKAMSVRLRAPDGGFIIEARSPETQWIENVLGIASDDFASWRWTLTARERGRRQLQLIVSARTVSLDGLTAETALPDQVIDVKVGINYGRTASRWAGWITAAVVGGLLARFGEGAFETGREILSKMLAG
jgi:hypothetical protein